MNEEMLDRLAAEFVSQRETSEELKSDVEVYRRRSERARKLLTPERIPDLSDEELRDLFFDTHSFRFWGNKGAGFKQRVDRAGLDGIRNALFELVTRAERGLTPEDLEAVWATGALGLLLSTELLCYRFPDRYWIYSPRVTLPAFQSFGVDVKAGLPRGKKTDAHIYFALQEPMERVREALKRAGLAEADYLDVDLFLWRLPTRQPLTPKELAKILEDGRRSPSTLAKTKQFLEQVAALLQEEVGPLEAKVGMGQKSGEKWNVQYLDYASFTLARQLVPGRAEGTAHPLSLSVYLLPGEIWWGVYAWAAMKGIEGLNRALKDTGLIQADEDPVTRKGGIGVSTEVWPGGGYLALGHSMRAEEVAAQPSLEAIAARIARDLASYYRRVAPRIDDLRRAMGRAMVADKGFAAELKGEPLAELLRRWFAAQGLKFSDWQVATFYTALQTKGFVILSGISGTGKTKLAQHFARLLPQPSLAPAQDREDVITVTVQPYMLKYARLIVPKRATRLFEPPPAGETREVQVLFDDQSESCRFVHASYGTSDYLSLLLRGSARDWFLQNFSEGDTLILDPQLGQEGDLSGFRFLRGDGEASADLAEGAPTAQNWLFVPVRPDWRDSKSLLGYYNPLTGTYQWTQFLRFLLRASQSYRAGDGLAWFVILDEMNLAHVEYYFADLLSVLESGRDEEGWTREPLRFEYPEEAEGDLPPAELRLPPNLYVVGTVNVDETTRAFSPKVLDRAFTLELTEADFTGYPATDLGGDPEVTAAEQYALLANFTFGGRFARIDKQAIAEYIAAHPDTRARLQTLSNLVQPYGLHFGFRVFDEIVSFLVAAQRNGLFALLGGDDLALDTAVLMKVLPKFHGSRSRLEPPLRSVLAWCVNPDEPALDEVSHALDEVQGASDPGDELVRQVESLQPTMRLTASRVRRMLLDLYTTGFAAFG